MSHFGRAGPPDIRDTYSLLVLNITFRTTADDLYPFFDRFGKVVDIFIPRDRRTGESRGFAFVRYKYVEEAQKAVNRLDGVTIDGRPIAVQFAKYGRNDEKINNGRITTLTKWFPNSSPRRSQRYRDDGHYQEHRHRSRERERERDRYGRDRSRDGYGREYDRYERRERDYERGRGRDRNCDRRDQDREWSRDRHEHRSRDRSRDRYEAADRSNHSGPDHRERTGKSSLSPAVRGRTPSRSRSPLPVDEKGMAQSPLPCNNGLEVRSPYDTDPDEA